VIPQVNDRPELVLAAEAGALETVRRRVLEQHRALREQLEGLAALRGPAMQRVPGAHETLVRTAVDVARALRAHLDFEDQVVLPTLETSDAWGSARRARVETEHASQRAVLDAFVTVLERTHEHPAEAVAAVDALCGTWLEDMTSEERDLLADDLPVEGARPGR